MKKVRNKFVLYAMIAIFVLITVLLFVINAISFTMAGEDADKLTQMIEEGHGTLRRAKGENDFDFRKKIGPMGPDSPEMNSSIRYFTVEFDKDEDYKARLVAFQISAISEEEAKSWARDLLGQKTGWTKTTYRYRVYQEDGKIYVTVVDQGRELLASYRILIISVCGEVAVMILSFILLMVMGKKAFKPLEEADRKQKKFIASIENEFKLPLTIINANTEIMEKEGGQSEYIHSINKQVKKMTGLVKDLGSLGIVNEKKLTIANINLSNILSAALDYRKPKFDEKNITLEHDIVPDIMVDGDEETIKKVVNELIDNAVKFSESKASFVLKRKNDRVTIIQTNDTGLANGNIDQIFDRFSTLENAKGKEGRGLGLSYVKDVIKAHNGRLSAKVTNGIFTLQIDL